MRLAASSYRGERIWGSKTETEVSTHLENVIVDPLTKLTVDSHLDIEVAKAIKTTNLCELEPAEDSFP